jgi:hypothetical protein
MLSIFLDRHLPARENDISSRHSLIIWGDISMRLEVFCEDRLGLTRELLDLLVLRGIDLRGIEIDPVGRIYLNFAALEFNTFSSLMARSAVSLA